MHSIYIVHCTLIVHVNIIYCYAKLRMATEQLLFKIFHYPLQSIPRLRVSIFDNSTGVSRVDVHVDIIPNIISRTTNSDYDTMTLRKIRIDV